MSKTILIVWEHGGNLGHLFRLLPIAVALRDAGYEVVFTVGNEVAARSYLESAGFSCLGMPKVAPETPSYAAGVLNHAELLLRTGFGRVAQVRRCIEQWHELFKSVKPQAALIDASPVCLYAARSAGLPAVALGHGFEIPPNRAQRPCFIPWAEDSDLKAEAFELQLERSLAELAQTIGGRGLPPPMSMDELYRPGNDAICAWPELDHFSRTTGDIDTAVSYTGPIWSEPVDAETYDWPTGDGSKVLCYLNLRDKRYDLIWQALKLQGADVLAISPAGLPRACQAARGWGINVVEHPVRLETLLSQCQAIVGHGGMGFTSMALQAGKPVLILPEHLEQGILAYRLGKQGLALATIRQNDKRLVNQKISQLLNDDSLRLQVRKFAAVYSTYAPSVAVDGIVTKLKNAMAEKAI
jgi:UDP:flavonoid glycosyltransferase YjiC (YdhE family)